MSGRITAFLSAAMFVAAFAAAPAFAQSSGNFSASVLGTACTTSNYSSSTSGYLPPVTIKVSSGSGTALLVTPSLVTGLYSDNKNASTTNVGVSVDLQVAPQNGQQPPIVSPANQVVYDQRIITVSGSMFSQLLNCTDQNPCLEIQETTLSAHSFNFIVTNLQSGSYTLTLSYGNTNGQSTNVASCVGPGSLTVQQVKNFSFNSPLNF